ncbi:MAG: DUF3160 domain-containing protein, partial [Planctomycetes bacterium]|nr:DUF3160 domain-containing protein [Planctomycetota bacterium]
WRAARASAPAPAPKKVETPAAQDLPAGASPPPDEPVRAAADGGPAADASPESAAPPSAESDLASPESAGFAPAPAPAVSITNASELGPLSLEEQLEVSAYLDGELDEDSTRRLESLLATDPRRQAELEALSEVSSLASEVVPLPSEEAWDSFMGDLKDELSHQLPDRATREPWRMIVAAAAAALLAFVVVGRVSDPPVSLALPRLPSKTLLLEPVLWEGALNPRPLPRLDQIAQADAAPLTSVALLRLAKEGMVQLPDAGLTTLREPAIAGPRPLATADASLLLWGAVSERAAISLEATLVRPALVELLIILDGELSAFERNQPAGIAGAALRARARLAVASRLLGHTPSFSEEWAEIVDEEFQRVKAATGPGKPKILNRHVDYRLFRPRGLHAHEATDHDRAVRWLGRSGFRVDAAEPDEVLQACLLTLALARGRASQSQSGLGLQLRLEPAIELLFGPPDDLTPSDVLSSMRHVCGRLAIRPSDLDSATLRAVARRLEVEARARGLGRVGRAEGRQIVLIGSTRSLEGTVASQLSSPRLPGRALPRSLDLLTLLGSRRARTALSAREQDPPGYDAALDALRGSVATFIDAQGGVPLRASLERSRLGALATLVGPRAERATRQGIASQQTLVYRDRLLLAAMAGLNGPGPAPDRLPSETTLGPLPLVEPLPALHARLAFSCRRLAEALESVAPGQTVLAVRQLRRLARLEEALRDASLDVLAGRPLPTGTQRELRALCPLFQAWVPRDVRSLGDVYELRNLQGVSILQRAVFRADRLYLVVPDPLSGVPSLGCGPALVATEILTLGGPLLPNELRERALSHPQWASHLEPPQ